MCIRDRALLHLPLHTAADALFHLQDVDLVLEQLEQLLEPLVDREQVEHDLLVLELERKVRGDGIGQTPGIVDAGDRGQDLGRDLLVELDVLVELRRHRAAQRLDLGRGIGRRRHRHDLADLTAIPALLEAIQATQGPLDALIQNAGVAAKVRGDMLDLTPENLDWIMGINLWGVIHGIRSFVPRMLASGEDGHVVNTASMAGMVTGEASGGPYSATKHAVVSISESLFCELKRAEAPLSASVLCPGWVDTGIVANSNRDAPVPSGFPGSMAEVPAVYAPSYVAGQVFDAIRDDRFYILATQDDFLGWMKMRHDRIESGRNPAVPRRRP